MEHILHDVVVDRVGEHIDRQIDRIHCTICKSEIFRQPWMTDESNIWKERTDAFLARHSPRVCPDQ